MGTKQKQKRKQKWIHATEQVTFHCPRAVFRTRQLGFARKMVIVTIDDVDILDRFDAFPSPELLTQVMLVA